jgi:hypothetical protein
VHILLRSRLSCAFFFVYIPVGKFLSIIPCCFIVVAAVVAVGVAVALAFVTAATAVAAFAPMAVAVALAVVA